MIMTQDELLKQVLALGATNAGLVKVEEIEFEPSFRAMCESNACGMYGKSWMCPPYVGEYQDLIEQAKRYDTALVYQIIGTLEDSYDFEGMMETGKRMNLLTDSIRSYLQDQSDILLLGAGGCRICPKCAKQDDQPCRFPDKALASLEAYCINVSKLAPMAGMKYINGQNTVTYFGAVFFRKGSFS